MTLQERLADIVGAANVLTAPEDTKPYFTDWRRQYSAPAECVVRPATTREVSQVVALCARDGAPVFTAAPVVRSFDVLAPGE